MISFLPIAILAYALEGGAVVINKIQLQTKQLNPVSYTFYSGILQALAIVLIPFGFNLNFTANTLLFAIFAGIFYILAMYVFFKSLKLNEVSVAGPLVGALNPLFTLIIGAAILNQTLSSSQFGAFMILIAGSLMLTLNLWVHNLTFGKNLLWICLAGLLFALSYVFLREAFLQTSFINGLVISRVAAGIFALSWIAIPVFRKQIISPDKNTPRVYNKPVLLLFLAAQVMAGLAVFLLFFATSLAPPALVNALFGVQYLIILPVALFLGKNHPSLLDENLKYNVLLQKIVGAGILSLGVYLLSK